jgi:hypothetical protein
MTSRSEERGELVPALTSEPELAERDASLVALVRNLASLEMRLAERTAEIKQNLAHEVTEQITGEIEEIDNALNETELSLQAFACELAVSKKVDAYAYMLAYLESQEDLLAHEVKRLETRKRSAGSIVKRMLRAAHYALSLLPEPGKHGIRELVGATASLALVRNPPKTEILMPALVPSDWKVVTLSMPLLLWEEILRSLPATGVGASAALLEQHLTIRKRDIGTAIKGGAHVPGAEWQQDWRVQRR